MLKDARSAFKSRTNDSFGVGNPTKQSKTQPWFQPPSNCGRCSLLVAVAMKSTWQRSGRRVLMRSEWRTERKGFKIQTNLKDKQRWASESQKWCVRDLMHLSSESVIPTCYTRMGQSGVFHSGSAVSLLICCFLRQHWVPICQASGDDECYMRIDIDIKNRLRLHKDKIRKEKHWEHWKHGCLGSALSVLAHPCQHTFQIFSTAEAWTKCFPAQSRTDWAAPSLEINLKQQQQQQKTTTSLLNIQSTSEWKQNCLDLKRKRASRLLKVIPNLSPCPSHWKAPPQPDAAPPWWGGTGEVMRGNPVQKVVWQVIWPHGQLHMTNPLCFTQSCLHRLQSQADPPCYCP